MTNHNLVAKARAALEGTTTWPWEFVVDYDDDGDAEAVEVLYRSQPFPTQIHRETLGASDKADSFTVANARFIAAAPELVATLADRVEELEAELNKYCAKMDRLLGLDDDHYHD